jgi:hypothetical protein
MDRGWADLRGFDVRHEAGVRVSAQRDAPIVRALRILLTIADRLTTAVSHRATCAPCSQSFEITRAVCVISCHARATNDMANQPPA